MELTLVISLAQLAYQTCKAAKSHKEECVRIGERLMALIVLTNEWAESNKRHNKPSNVPSHSTVCSLEKALQRLNLTLQAAITPKSLWTSRVKNSMQSRDLLEAIHKAELDLNEVLQDTRLHQGNPLYHQNKDLSQQFQLRVEMILAQLARQDSPCKPGQTYQQQMDAILNECLTQAPLALMSSSSSTSLTASFGSSFQSSSNSISSSTFILQEEDVQKVTIDFDNLKCTFSQEELIGDGGFSEVFAGMYQGTKVAIKRLKIHEADLLKMSPSEKNKQINRINAESVLMSRAGIHPNIVQVLGCHTALTKIERPLIVMELLPTTFFLALHEGKIGSYKERLKLLSGVAAALEFLHLQGIVHGDVRSLNILLNGNRTIAKLSDFGEAKGKGFAATHAMASSMSTGHPTKGGGPAGTLAYQSPEQLLQAVTDASRKAEIHSFGVVLWEAITDKIPHRGKSPMEMLLMAQDENRKTLLDLPDPTLREGNYPSWKTMYHMCRACLSRSVHARPTTSQLVHGLTEGPEKAALLERQVRVQEAAFFPEVAHTHQSPASYSYEPPPPAPYLPQQPSVAIQAYAPAPTHRRGDITLIIERRVKQLGIDTGWYVYLNGRFRTRLWTGNKIQLNNLAKGDIVTLRLLRAEHYLTVQDNDDKKTLRFRAKTCGDINFKATGLADKQWIEPCKSDNWDLDSQALVWRKGPKISRRAVTAVGPPHAGLQGYAQAAYQSFPPAVPQTPMASDNGVLYA